MAQNTKRFSFLSTTLLAGLALALAMPLSAQSASYKYIDQKAPYKNWTNPGLVALTLPKIGTTFKVSVPGSTALSHGPYFILATGVRNPNVPLAPVGGFLFTSAEHSVFTPRTWGWGMVTMSFPIPNSAKLLGTRFYQQVLSAYSCGLGPGPCPKPLLSRGGYGVIGK